MPRDFLRRYTAPEIAEIMAYYRIKAEDEARRQNQFDIERQRAEKRRPRRR